MAWWSFAVALLVAAGTEHTDLVEHIWMPISYMYLPISGSCIWRLVADAGAACCPGGPAILHSMR